MQQTLFFDLDGTLLGRSRVLHPETKEALRITREKGNRIFMCSGRSAMYLRRNICEEVEFDGIVACAGGYVGVFDGKGGEQCIFENRIEPALLQTILAAFHEAGIVYQFETGRGVYISRESEEQFTNIIDSLYHLSEEELRQRREESQMEWDKGINIALSEWTIDDPMPKLLFIAPERSRFDALYPMLAQHFKFNYFIDSDSVLMGELIPHDCTKRHGIEEVMAYYGDTLEHAVGFGDSMNDLEMIQAVRTGVVYEGSPKELLDAATHTFIDPDEGGIALAMKALHLY